MQSVLGFVAGGWAIAMGLAPILQVRRMAQRQSSADFSVGYVLILLPGFALWVGYGVVAGNMFLVVPNALAFVVASLTVVYALRLRVPSPRSREVERV